MPFKPHPSFETLKKLVRKSFLTTLIFVFFMNLSPENNYVYADSPLKTQWAFENCSLAEYDYQNTQSNDLLIFFNGIPVTSLIYQNLIAQLIDHRIPQNIIRADLPGTGQSKMKWISEKQLSIHKNKVPRKKSQRKNPYTWTHMRKCVEHYFQKKIAENYELNLVIHDIAGPVVLPLLEKYEKHINRVIVLNTIVRSSGFKPIFPLNFVKAPLIGLLASNLTGKNFYTKNFLRDGITDPAYQSEVHEIYRDFKSQQGKSRLYYILQGFESGTNSDQMMATGLRSDVNKLVIWADSDPSLAYQKEYVFDILPTQRVETISSAKHFFMIDYAQELSDKIAPFLRGN